MNAFDRLHPALQHHVVNTLGWRKLRPLQQQAIEPILARNHVLVIAPTAGGKTEAAVFPILSRMLDENWGAPSVLYVCPLKALLNDLHTRLKMYCQMVGRRCGVWHGDVSDGVKKRIRANPPDILLTTPESLEVMLISSRTEHTTFFENLKTVVVDEIHAFAGDDRGWHLLLVMERLRGLVQHNYQRIGLSATVGNPDSLLNWLAGHCDGNLEVICPESVAAVTTDVQIDFVGNLDNAGIVISRLHRGEKRLVFCDSRSRVEKLAARLRDLGVTTFVSHSSLSADQRRDAETAFQQQNDCVIVATSTLELGIDVGDLDRVIQIDAPSTVAAFLQRLGRTGRRPGTSRNCLFLATTDDALIQAAAIIRLWTQGFVEPIVPPAEPWHIFAQQLMALCLQEKGIGRQTWTEWYDQLPMLNAASKERLAEVTNHMLTTGILSSDQGTLWFGVEGERAFGCKNFMELCSVFASDPLFSVYHGNTEIGSIHETTFMTADDEPVILLGGRSWRVVSINWSKRRVTVEQVDLPGRSRWLGSGADLSAELSAAMKQVLLAEIDSHSFSRRAADRLEVLQNEFAWVSEGKSVVCREHDGYVWWTFAGAKANRYLAVLLSAICGELPRSDNLRIWLETQTPHDLLGALSDQSPEDLDINTVFGSFTDQVKFAACLPQSVLELMCKARYLDPAGAQNLIKTRPHILESAGNQLDDRMDHPTV